MPRNQTRRGISEGLELAGAVDVAAGPKLSDDIQLTYLVSDISGLMPQIPRPLFVDSQSSPINVGLFGIVELQAPPDSAIVIVWMRNDNAFANIKFSIESATTIVADLFVLSPGISVTGAASRAAYRNGTGSSTPEVLIPLSESLPDAFPDMVIPPGQILVVSSNSINQTCALSLSWFELPIAASTI